MSFYNVGTASVANGATTVSFAGANLGTKANPSVQAGDLFCDPDQPPVPPQRIDAIDYDTAEAVLWAPWPGTSLVNAAYEVRDVGDPIRFTSVTRRYIELLGQLSSLGIQPNAFGLFAGRDAYDGEDENFIYLSLDGDGDTSTAWTLFIKLSDASGDWDDGQAMTGAPGPQGENVVWRTGSTAPSSGLGNNGDMYLRTNGDIYGPKAAGAWGSVIASIVGPQGDPGADGSDPGTLLTWDDSTADADAGAGKIWANDASLASATVLYVSKTNRLGNDISAALARLTRSTSAVKGTIVLTAGNNTQALLELTGLTDATGYVRLAISNHSGATAIVEGVATSFQLEATGDAGTGAVNSVNGHSGTVTLDAGDVGAIPSSYLDTDGTLAANSDTKVPSQKAVKTYVAAYIAAQDVEVFKGFIDCSSNPNYPAADAGHVYRVSVAGKIGGASGVNVEVNDRLECVVDSTASGNHATVGSSWMISQTNIDGAVTGPTSAVDGEIALYNSTTGKIIKRASATGILLANAGVLGVVTIGSGLSFAGGTLSSTSSGMTDEQRRNALLMLANQSKALASSMRVLATFADGFKATDGINSGASSEYAVNTTSGYVGPIYDSGNDTYTKLLLHLNGSNNSTTFTDSAAGATAHTMTAVSGAKLATASSKFGSAALTLNGSSDYVTTPNDFAIGSQNFTIDWWQYKSAESSYDCPFCYDSASGTYSGKMYMTLGSSGAAGFLVANSSSNGWALNMSFTKPSLNAWHHIAVVRSGNDWYIFVDGVQAATTSNSAAINAPTANFIIGSQQGSASTFFNGLIDEFRVSVGVARWTSAFTPPTRAYAATAYTNVTLVTAYQTADASVSKARALFEIDPIDAITLGTDLTIELTCNGGANWTAAGSYTNAGKGQAARTVIETNDVTCTAGTSFAARLKTLNNKNVNVYKSAVAVHA